MSNEQSKEKHSRRIHQKAVHIKHNLEIARVNNIPVKDEHRLLKCGPVSCGNPNCVLCANPRRVFKEPTLAEKSFDQTSGWLE